MTPRHLRNNHTMRNRCRNALSCVNIALKLPWYFYLLMEKPLVYYFHVWPPYYQAAQCNQKTPILVSSRCQVRSEKAKKRININTNGSYHYQSSCQTSLNWSNNKASCSFNQPNRKLWDAKLVNVLVNVKHLPSKAFL